MDTNNAITIFLNSRQAKGLSQDTIRWYRGILLKFAHNYQQVPDIPEPIEQFMASITAGDERRHGYYRTLKCFYRFLHRRYKAEDVMVIVEAPKRKPKLPKPLSPDELNQLLSYPHLARVKGILMFLIDTGARVGELTSLQPSDITETPWGYVARITGKTGTRIVPISTEVYTTLAKYLPLGWSRYTIRRKVADAFNEARVPGSAINLRHSFGTLWQGDELILQRIMGHTHLSTTKIYRELRMELMCKQHHQYTPLKMVYPLAKSML